MAQVPLPFISRQRIEFDMFDALGVLYNANYLILFERARHDFWRANGLEMGGEGFDWPYYVAHHDVDYLLPIIRQGEAEITVAIAEIGRSSATFAHEIRLAGSATSARARTVLVRVDPVTLRPTPWSERFRAIFTAHLQRESG